jgi:hypothetical protein
MLDNIEIAVLTKLNELAERRGLKPYDFVATYGLDNATEQFVLRFEFPASGNPVREERFDKMLHDLGIVIGASVKLTGTPEKIVDALDHALDLSPKPRWRF